MPRRSRPGPSRWKRAALWSLPIFFVLLLAGFFAAKAAIDAYLRSERFRTFLAQKAGRTLEAEAEVAPLHADSTSFYTDGFSARGSAASAFSNLQIDGLRAELSWRRFFEKVWQVDRVEVQRVQVQLDGPRIEMPPSVVRAPSQEEPARSGSGWLPDRVEIANAEIHEANLLWKDGGLRGTAWRILPSDGGWNLKGASGKLAHGTLPPLDVQRIELRYREPAIHVNHAEFRQGAGGSIVVSGEVKTDERLDLHAVLQNITLTPWLAGDWRARLHGEAAGEVDIRSPLPIRGEPEIRGSLTIAHGMIEALPVLDQIAVFTRTAQFRRFALSTARGDFVRTGQRLTVTNLILESERLIRVEGSFAIENGTIDGTFQVGVAPTSLQMLPGSQTRVFTETRGAYVWAPMKLIGPLDAPKEDLSARLASAAAGALVEDATGTVKDVTNAAKDAARSALDLFLSPPK